MVRGMKPSYSSLLGFQIQFDLDDLSLSDRLELVFRLVESLPAEAKFQLYVEIKNLIREIENN
jgi:hypothetical protein